MRLHVRVRLRHADGAGQRIRQAVGLLGPVLGAGFARAELELGVEAQVDLLDGFTDEDELRLAARRQHRQPAAVRIRRHVLDCDQPETRSARVAKYVFFAIRRDAASGPTVGTTVISGFSNRRSICCLLKLLLCRAGVRSV